MAAEHSPPAALPAADAGAGERRAGERVLAANRARGAARERRRRPATQAARVRTAWDEREWRLLFDADDTRPWATLTAHDAPLWTEEVMEVFFDPVGDLGSYFEVEINPLGAVVDVVLRRTASGWRKDFAWDVEGLVSAARLTPGGWAAELAIPFEALGASMRPEAGRTAWRANFLRVDMPGGPGTVQDLSAWSPTRLRNFHRAEAFGTVEFVD